MAAPDRWPAADDPTAEVVGRRRDRPDAPPPPARRAAHRAGQVYPRPWSLGPVRGRAAAADEPRATSWPASAPARRRLRRAAVRRRRRPRHHRRRRPDAGAARGSARACCSCWCARRIARGVDRAHPRGAGVEHRRAGAVPPLRLRARRRPQELLRRHRRGRARHVGPRRRHPSTGAPRRLEAARHAAATEVSASRRRRVRSIPPSRRPPIRRPHERPPTATTSSTSPTRPTTDDPRHRDVVRRDGGGGRRRRPPTSLSSVVSSQVDLHARFGGVVPEIASRAHVELLTPVVAEALVEAGVERRRASTRSPPPSGRAWSARCSSACQRGQGAGAGVGRAVRGGQPPRGPPLRRAPRGARRSSCPLVVLLVSGGHTMLVAHGGPRRATGCSARPSTTPPARRSTRWPATSASATRAARPSTAIADGGRSRRPSRSPGRCSTTATTSPSAGSRPSVVNHVRKHPDVGDGRRGRLVPGGRGRRARHQGPARPRRRSAPRACASAAAWPPTRCCASGSSTRAWPTACTAFLPSRAMCTDNAAMVAAAGW